MPELAQTAEELVSEELLRSATSRSYEDLVREVIPLTEQDVEILALHGPEHSQTQVREIRAYHHMVALRLALGERPVQICAALGLTPQTITRLQNSPQFAELVTEYRSRVVTKAIDHMELMSAVSAEALSALLERLDSDDRDNIPVEMLRRLAETFVDRIGHSPVRRSESHSVHRVELDATGIERIKRLHAEQRRLGNGSADQTDLVVDAAFTSHAEASRRAGAEECSAAVFLPASQAKQDDSDAGSGEGV